MRWGMLTVLAVGLLHACSDDTTTSTPADAGAETSTNPPRDGSVPVEDSATCDPSADITTGYADAAIADGASTTGICFACITSKCKTQLDACVADCICQVIAGNILDCYSKHGDTVACRFNKSGPGSSPINDPPTEPFIQCLDHECVEACGGKADGGADASDASDASTD